MTDLHALDLLIDLAGRNASAMDTALAAARGNGDTNPDVVLAHNLVARLGNVLSQMQKWVDAAMAPVPVVVVGGVRFNAVAPINPAWKPSMEDIAVGAGTVLAEPGNPPGARSPAGYPMVNGLVLYNGQTFADDAAVATYIAAVNASGVGIHMQQTVAVPTQSEPAARLAPLAGNLLGLMRVVQGHDPARPSSTDAEVELEQAMTAAGIPQVTQRDYVQAYGPGGYLSGTLSAS